MQQTEHINIGVDPHKLSATIEVVDQHEKMLGSGRFTTDQAGYKAMPCGPTRSRGRTGSGRSKVPTVSDDRWPNASSRPARKSSTSRPSSLPGSGSSTPATIARPDARDAHSIAIVAVRTKTLRVLRVDGELEALRMLTDRREALTRRRVQTVDRLQALLAELLPGQAKRDITTGQARAMLASVRPRDIAGKTRRRIAADELAELIAVEAKIKKATAELKAIVLARGSTLMDLTGSAR